MYKRTFGGRDPWRSGCRVGLVLAACLWAASAAAFIPGLTKLLGGASELSDTGKLATKVDGPGGLAPAMRAALIARPGLRAVMRDGAQFFAVDAAGSRMSLAAVTATGAVQLSDGAARRLNEWTLLIDEAQLPALRPLAEQVLAVRQGAVLVLLAEGSTVPLRVMSGSAPGSGSGTFLALQVRPGVHVSLGAGIEVPSLLAQAIDRSRVRVVSIFDESDADTVHRLDGAAGELHLRAGQAPPGGVAELIRSQVRGTVLLVGHVEAGSFVVRDAGGVLRQQVSIASLEEAAASADAALVLLGCRAGACSRSAGFVADVNARQVAAGIRSALDAGSLGEALGALANGSGDLLIHGATTTAWRSQLNMRQLLDRKPGADAAWDIVGVTTISAARASELRSRLIPGIPSVLQLSYFAGCVLLLFQARQTWRAWRPTWRPAPAPRRAPVRFVAVHVTRWLVFAGVMPWAVLLLYAAHLAPWVLALGLLVLAWPAALVGAVAGWRWWRSHRVDVADQPSVRALMAIPVLTVGVALPVAMVAISIDAAAAWHGTFSVALHSPASWLLQAVLAVPVAQWLQKRAQARRRLPASVLLALASQPLRVVEAATEQVWWRGSRTHGEH